MENSCQPKNHNEDSDSLDKIKEILPHRDPFLFLTRIETLKQANRQQLNMTYPMITSSSRDTFQENLFCLELLFLK